MKQDRNASETDLMFQHEEKINADAFITEVAEKGEDHDEICAGFRLAQFVEDYGEFLEAAAPDRTFE